MELTKYEIAEALEFHTGHSVSIHGGMFILLHKTTGEIMNIYNFCEAQEFLRNQESEQYAS